MKRSLVYLAAAAAFLLPASAVPMAAQIISTSVGPGSTCEFDDLGNAIDSLMSQPADERIVKLQRGLFENVAISVDTNQLTLAGGFDSCDDEQPAQIGRSILLGTLDQPVIAHQGVAGLQGNDPPTLLLRQVELGDGDGGLTILGPARVDLEDVLILGNSKRTGGGILIEAFPGFVDLTLTRTSINGNETQAAGLAHGGGIACFGVALIEIGSGSSLVGNKTAAQGKGGGVYLDDCLLLARGQVDISSNRGHFGGGLALVGSAAARFFPDESGLPEIRFNLAEERDGIPGQGGGIYVEGGSELTMEAGRVENNRAFPLLGDGGKGGGVFIESSVAAFESENPVGLNGCDGPCLSLSANEASDGAAGFVRRGASLRLFQTLIEANVGGSVLEIDNGGNVFSLGFLESSFVTRNATPKLFVVEGPSSLGLVHVSAGGNLSVDTAIEATDFSDLSLRSSVIFEPGAQIAKLGDSVDLTAECTLLSDASSFALHPSVIEQDPLFVDAVAGNLHLEPTSPAIDLCEELSGLGPDIDGQDRVVDQAVVPDDATPADAGADEVSFIEPPEPDVFSDGFESGDFSAWSDVVQ